MRKLSLSPYTYGGEEYDVKRSLVALLFSPALRLGAHQICENDRIAQKIESGNGSVLLEESDYQTLRNSVEVFEGYGRADIQLIERVLASPEVQVEEING